MEMLDCFAWLAFPYVTYKAMQGGGLFAGFIAGLLWVAYFIRMRSAQWAENDLRDTQRKLEALKERHDHNDK